MDHKEYYLLMIVYLIKVQYTIKKLEKNIQYNYMKKQIKM